MTDFKPHPDGGSVLQMGVTAQQRLTAMLATWLAQREALHVERYTIGRSVDHGSPAEIAAADVEEGLVVNKMLELDESVINALASLIRLGGLAMADNQDPPSLIVSTPHLTYGVSVLRSIGMKWSVDS
jgi:hypothetical protein